MQTGHDVINKSSLHIFRAEERHRTRRLLVISIAAFVLLFAFSMCLRTSQVDLISPVVAMQNLFTWLKLVIAKWLDLPLYLESEAIISKLPFYFETVARFKLV